MLFPHHECEIAQSTNFTHKPYFARFWAHTAMVGYDGAKMSKSVGNIVDPVVLSDKYSADTLRYYLMSDMATGQDADFSEERLVERYNTDLANSLGNLLNRTLNMAHRYRQGVVTRTGGDSPLAVQTADLLHGYRSAFSRLEVHAAMKRLMEFATTCNTYIEMSAPWKLAKDPNRAEALDHVLSVLAESLRVIGAPAPKSLGTPCSHRRNTGSKSACAVR